MSKIREFITQEYVRSIMKAGKPINKIMQDIMKIGKKITEEIGFKEYNTIEEFFEDINNGTSPLFEIDDITIANIDNCGKNIFAVKKCPIADLMEKMKTSQDDHDHLVLTALNNFQIREGESYQFIDIGCYIMQQIRQMVVSSISIAGTHSVNYIHLACKRDQEEIVFSQGDVEAIKIDKKLLEKILENHHCVYALYSTIEDQKNENKE